MKTLTSILFLLFLCFTLKAQSDSSLYKIIKKIFYDSRVYPKVFLEYKALDLVQVERLEQFTFSTSCWPERRPTGRSENLKPTML